MAQISKHNLAIFLGCYQFLSSWLSSRVIRFAIFVVKKRENIWKEKGA